MKICSEVAELLLDADTQIFTTSLQTNLKIGCNVMCITRMQQNFHILKMRFLIIKKNCSGPLNFELPNHVLLYLSAAAKVLVLILYITHHTTQCLFTVNKSNSNQKLNVIHVLPLSSMLKFLPLGIELVIGKVISLHLIISI